MTINIDAPTDRRWSIRLLQDLWLSRSLCDLIFTVFPEKPWFESWQQRLDTRKANRIFEVFVAAVIIFSALMIGAHTSNLSSTLLHVLALFDIFVTAFFLVKISIRFLAEENKKNFCKSFWNLFDTLIVAVSLFPISNSDVAVMGRLIRIFRVLRLVSIVPELRRLLNSLIKALPLLGYVLLMFIIFISTPPPERRFLRI